MYLSLRTRPVIPDAPVRPARGRVPRTVWLLGLTSMLTDISSEMVTAILPIFLTLQLGLSPAQFGLIDGLHQGVSALSRLGAGLVSDRLGNPKLVASFGYGLSALTRPLLLLAGSVMSVAALVSVDRIGKGVRTAPRDAMIAQSSTRSDLGANFGVHRALDNLGAMLGPLLAFGVLFLAPLRFDTVFVFSAAFAVIGLAVIVFLVPGPERGKHSPRSSRVRLTRADVAALAVLAPFRRLVVVGGLLTLFTVSDAFLFLTLLEGDAALTRYFPLLAVGLALSYAALAIPVGRLADRWGRSKVYLWGHLLLLAIYAVVAGQLGAIPAALVTLGLMGLFYASTDGVLTASISAELPEVSRASGLALAQTVIALAALTSSVGFGLLLTFLEPTEAFLVMATGEALALVAAYVLLRPALVRPTQERL